ncbi:unnamed protein product [Protopolystoma xenopodis]|uniref:Uncharacterized protein n=1 Tax=Protopolystoma xenopodis TaxID=117903 RepID=A0A3S5CCN5_9PLAT|nr:unnamed protein product [Protopolystoma xenopodis]
MYRGSQSPACNPFLGSAAFQPVVRPDRLAKGGPATHQLGNPATRQPGHQTGRYSEQRTHPPRQRAEEAGAAALMRPRSSAYSSTQPQLQTNIYTDTDEQIYTQTDGLDGLPRGQQYAATCCDGHSGMPSTQG